MPAPRWILLCSLTLALISGCQPSDPLDWKISAKTPADLDTWAGETMILLPPELAAELKQSIHIISNHTPQTRIRSVERAYHSTNAVCRKLHQHTIRNTLATGYLLSNGTLLRKTNLILDDITKDTIRLTQFDPGSRQYLTVESSIAIRQKTVATLTRVRQSGSHSY